MTVIYRLETTCGTGVYRSSASRLVEFDDSRHPMPYDDSLLMTNLGEKDFCGNFHFGFISIEQLRAWFYRDECLRIMDEHEIVLSIYEAEEVYIGNTQLCFNRNTSELKSKNNLLEFFGLGEK